MSCSRNNIHIFSANETSLSNTLAIISLKLVIWLVSLPLSRSILSCLLFSSSLYLSIHFLMSSQMPSLYSGLSRISSSFCFSHSVHCCNSTFFAISTLSEPRMLMSCLSRPWSSRMGNLSENVPSNCLMRFQVLLAAFSVISQSSMLSTLAKSDIEGSSSFTLFSLMACQSINLPSMGMSKPKSRRPSSSNISTMAPTYLSFPPLIIKGVLLSLWYSFPSLSSKLSKWNASGVWPVISDSS